MMDLMVYVLVFFLCLCENKRMEIVEMPVGRINKSVSKQYISVML